MPDRRPSLAIRIVYRCYTSVVSPVLHAFSPSQCLYLPTCSEYAYVALVRFGVLKGSWLALRRLEKEFCSDVKDEVLRDLDDELHKG